MYCALAYLDCYSKSIFIRQKPLIEHDLDGWHRLPFSSVDFWQILDSFEKTHKIVAYFSKRIKRVSTQAIFWFLRIKFWQQKN